MKNQIHLSPSTGASPDHSLLMPPEIPLTQEPFMLAELKAAGVELVETRVHPADGSYPSCLPEHPNAQKGTREL